MKRSILIGVLAFGTLAGFASGFRSLHSARERRESFERHVAQVCVDAARNAPPPGGGNAFSPR